ncbi:MAG: helix-turn-helix transcriptional regulator [Bacteroidota bacterium]
MRRTQMLSQEQFGKIMGLTSSAVSKFERGEGNVTLENLLIIAEHFNLSLDDLVFTDLSNDKIETKKPNGSPDKIETLEEKVALLELKMDLYDFAISNLDTKDLQSTLNILLDGLRKLK